MYFGEIMTADTGNGPGFRLSLFVSGCTNHCPGCFQPETWDFKYGKEYNVGLEQYIMDQLKQPWYRGITILGGEPFEPANQRVLSHFVQRIRRELPQKDIWMYTGNLYEDMLPNGRRYCEVTDNILDNIDVLVDGRFVEHLKNVSLKFRGSSNQRIIDIPATRKIGEVVLKEEFM